MKSPKNKRPCSFNDQRHKKTSDTAKMSHVWQQRTGTAYYQCEHKGCTVPYFVSNFAQHVHCRDHFIAYMKLGIIPRPTRLCQVCEEGPIVHCHHNSYWMDAQLVLALQTGVTEKKQGRPVSTFYTCDYEKCKRILEKAMMRVMVNIETGKYDPRNNGAHRELSTTDFVKYIDEERRAIGWVPPVGVPDLSEKKIMTYADKMDWLTIFRDYYLTHAMSKPDFSLCMAAHVVNQSTVSQLWNRAKQSDSEKYIEAWKWVKERSEQELKHLSESHSMLAEQFGIPTISAGHMIKGMLQRIEEFKEKDNVVG